VAHATETDSPDSIQDKTRHPLGLVLLYCGGLARAGEHLTLGGRAAVLLGREERLFPGGPLADPRMSGRHAALTIDGGHWTLFDPGSKNGTFINGERVQRRVLEPGDVIRLGSTFVAFAHLGGPGHRSHLNAAGAAMAEVEEGIALVAPTDHTVLIVGESGTGKELVARELHRASGRGGPLLAINCASLRGELLESELFGHARGAFTGAHKSHDGIFLRASSGTVFLDEVGEMEQGAQARLLRVLETHSVRPVGASEEVAINARVVAATNRELDTLVAGEHVRADLYARLARWTIKLPPLRARREDLGVLVRALLAREGAGLDVTPELMAAICEAPWALNVRGLLNVLSSARIAQPRATRLDLVDHVRRALESQAKAARPASEAGEAARTTEPPGRERLAELLAKHRGNVAKVAGETGMTRQSLYRLLERLELDPSTYR
jgi:DNA-binding NtrC family response regulator